ncbi:NAD-dependent epimerase/dehydratase family protein [Butyrivibrio sp. JL13D10]|uniref:NAD-dependent epimerase/dehydratase family protein n=1 Tax=Butyrivibrio sp. JL13D10 TaxID=3236815 RepID=UPI0038B4578E
MENVVVTGASGFLGSNMVEALSEEGYRVYALIRPGSKNSDRLVNIPNVETIEYDISDTDSKLENLIPNKCIFLFHFAWAGDFYNLEDQIKNINYTLNLVSSAKKIGCKRLIFAGSQAEYGVSDRQLNEDSMVLPIGAYGVAKVATCFCSRIKARELGIEWIWGRIFSVYGKNDLDKHLIPKLINSIKDNKVIELSSCRQMWDFLHIDDFTNAFILLARRGIDGNIYNVADGRYRHLKDYIEVIKEYTGVDIVKYGDDPNPFVSLKPDVSKLKRDTGWEPQINFEDGIKPFLRIR